MNAERIVGGVRFSYELKPRPESLGGGWHLRLLEDGEEMGGGVFPAMTDDEAVNACADAQAEGEQWLTTR